MLRAPVKVGRIISGLPSEKYVPSDPSGTSIVEPITDTAICPQLRNRGIVAIGIMEDMSPDIEAVDSILRGGKAEKGIFSPRKEGNPIIEIIW